MPRPSPSSVPPPDRSSAASLRPRFGGVAALLGLLALAGCKRGSAAPLDTPQAPPPPAVTVLRLAAEPIADVGRFTGRLAAIDQVELRPRVSGTLDSLHFEAGQLVSAGQLLFSIDPRPYAAARASAAAALAEAEVRRDNARREWQRAQLLADSRAISTEELDQRRAALAESEASLGSRKAALDLAELDLSFTRVTAPVAGRIGRALVTPGNLVSGQAGGATHLATLVSVDPLHVYADLDEASFLALERAKAAGELPLDESGRVRLTVDLAEGAGAGLAAVLESLDNQVSASTGTLLLRALLPNPDGRLVPGLFARVSVPLSAELPRLMLPERAIGTDQSLRYVWVVGEGNAVERRTVVLGPARGDRRAVLSGLSAGERVVVNGTSMLRFPGQVVTPSEPAAEPSSNAVPQGG